jgi:hypothetical protein
MRGKLFKKLNEMCMVKLYISTQNNNILKFIAKYFPHFRYLGNAKSYTIDYAAEARHTNSMEYMGPQRQPSVFALPSSLIYLKTCSLFRDASQS